MAFVRSFNDKKIDNMSRANPELYRLLCADIYNGLVFPTVRNGEMHFYHRGGCLYKFTGNRFFRDPNYSNGKYDEDTDGLDFYSKAKKQNENRYANFDGTARERQLLDSLNNHTFANIGEMKTIVLDVEACFRNSVGKLMKCDLVLLNTEANQIMFVEGKVFSDKRVNVAVGFVPEVIEQVNDYTNVIHDQRQDIVKQYEKHIDIINKAFGTKYDSNISLVSTAKLLVYETPKTPNANGQYGISIINDRLGKNNVAWYVTGEKPCIDKIWSALCK